LRRQAKTVNALVTTFLLDGGEEIGEYDGAGGGATRRWFHCDRLGSTIAMSRSGPSTLHFSSRTAIAITKTDRNVRYTRHAVENAMCAGLLPMSMRPRL
jgi:hypothetical protein